MSRSRSRSTEDLVDAGIGWVQESVATTEGSAIYLPPYVSTFNEQRQNFLSYKVYATHQSGRMEFGSFLFDFGTPGAHLASTLAGREEARLSHNGESENGATAIAVTTSMERYFDLFDDRALISGLFTIVEDSRIDSHISREYSGIRPALHRLQAHEAENRRNISQLALREAYLENLLRASLHQPETMRWPGELMPLLLRGLAQLEIVQQRDADVQDTAEAAAAIYAFVEAIPNIVGAYEEIDWDQPDEDMLQIGAEAGGADGPEMPHGEETDFEAPPQPEFRGDFKPEIVQLMMKLKQQAQGEEPMGGQLTQEQLEALLEKSVEITISDIAEGDIASSMGMFLTNLEREALDAKQGPPARHPTAPTPANRRAAWAPRICRSRSTGPTTTSGTSAPATTAHAGAASASAPPRRASSTTTRTRCAPITASSPRRAASSSCCAPSTSAASSASRTARMSTSTR